MENGNGEKYRDFVELVRGLVRPIVTFAAIYFLYIILQAAIKASDGAVILVILAIAEAIVAYWFGAKQGEKSGVSKYLAELEKNKKNGG